MPRAAACSITTSPTIKALGRPVRPTTSSAGSRAGPPPAGPPRFRTRHHPPATTSRPGCRSPPDTPAPSAPDRRIHGSRRSSCLPTDPREYRPRNAVPCTWGPPRSLRIRSSGSARSIKRLVIVADNSLIVEAIRIGFRQSGGVQPRRTRRRPPKPPPRQSSTAAPDVILLDDMDRSERALALIREITAND